jgi:NADH-quinone oxidoreductase subunit C
MTTPEEITRLLQLRFSGMILESTDGGLHPHVHIKPEGLLPVCRFLKDGPTLRFDLLRCISTVDWPQKNGIEISYDLMSILFSHTFAVKLALDRAQAEVESVTSVWPAAEWHEREAFDLMGVLFRNHPDARRILLPDDWSGHPLRKDYRDPIEYHGLEVKP